MTYTIAGTDLGQVQSEEHRVFSSLDYQSFPISTSKDALVFDYQGVKRIITLTGEKNGTEAQLMNNLITPIEALQDGNQDAAIFHSDLYDFGSGKDGNFNVKVDTFRWTWKRGVPGLLVYTLIIFEGE